MSLTIENLVKDLQGIDIIKFKSGLNIWFNPSVDHRLFWKTVKESKIPYKYMGIDEINGRYGDCYFFPF